VPVDDTHVRSANIRWMPADEDETLLSGRAKLAPGGRSDTSYEYGQRHPDDKEAQEGQGEIANHRLEHHVTSDEGVLMFRRILRTAIEAVRENKDPKGIIRDPQKAACVPTTAGARVWEEGGRRTRAG
ncbi:MAG: hypothetical protein OXE53_19175, partial [Deltaproteobacteria bacterium]|nr:hypothetical protein [Deltaproteobacteria bacterium]